MARRVSWINNSSGHSGTYVYRAPTLDPQNLPAPVATVGAVAQGAAAEWIDSEELATGDYDYAAQDFDGQGVGQVSAVVPHAITEDFSSVQIGDEVGGGIYAGVITYADSRQFHLIMAKASSEVLDLLWKTSATTTIGLTEADDGFFNTQEIVAQGISDHPAAEHCVNYTSGEFDDFYLPSWNELLHIASALAGHPELSDNEASTARTWTSTERDNGADVIEVAMSSAFASWRVKDVAGRFTRPIRRVPA